MKRIISSVLILVLMFSLCFALVACGAGADGAQGLQGEKGDKGETGATGAQGPQGEKGDKGETGATGAQGPQGEKGDKGETGATGAQGPQGEKGDKGETGATGAQGPQGEKGDKGETGATGPQGPQGATGATGPQGEPGATIEKIEFDEEGRLVITLTDGTVLAPVVLPEKEEHIHTYGKWEAYGHDTSVYCEDRLYYRICSGCSVFEWRKGTYDDHAFKDEYSHNESSHWLDCEKCEKKDSVNVHTVDESGFCTLCDRPVSGTVGVVYALSGDGTYAEVTGYNGTSDKVNIASEYEGVPVKSIQDEAFRQKRIQQVVIPDSVTSIGAYAFGGCNNLTSVTIGNSVTSIGSSAFNWCSNLENMTIPNSVTSIGSYAFEGCGSLKNVTIPNSVTSIGNIAFRDCYSLTNIEVDENNTAYKDIDGNLYTKDEKTFIQYAIGKTNTSFVIPDSVTSISNWAFYGCDLKNVTIPNSVTSIGDSTFYCCYSLTNIEVDENNTAYKDIDGNLYTKDEKTFIQYAIGKTNTSFVIPNGVEIIKGDAFSNCDSLTSVIIPNSVTSIGDSTFYECDSLTSVTIGNSVTSIGYSTFYGCDSLTSVTIGNSVTSIGSYAFNKCTALKTVILPKSVTQIDNYAFDGCTAITDVYYAGNSNEFNSINIANIGNGVLLSANIHFNYNAE